MSRQTGARNFVCKLCRSNKIDEIYVLRDSRDASFDVVRCVRCGLFQTLYEWQAVPPLKVITDLDHVILSEPWGGERELAAQRRKGTALAGILNSQGLLKHARILDVGCGDGYFLSACRDFGAASITGLEFRNANILHAREKLGIRDIRTVPIHDRDVWPDAEFDVVCSIDVIEHVHDLKQFFENSIRIAKPGGVLYHATPGFDSVSHRLGRLLIRMGVDGAGTVLCNVQPAKDLIGGPHVSILGIRQLQWLSTELNLSLISIAYINSYSYSDRHYVSLVPILKNLPLPLSSALFRIARGTVRNKLVFTARVHK